jgi:Ca2+-binding RTX toxin-like protein
MNYNRDYFGENFKFYDNFFKQQDFFRQDNQKFRESVANYYKFLKNLGFDYGDLAYDVSQNKGISSSMANEYLDNAMREEHPEWNKEERQKKRDEIMFNLASKDAELRLKSFRIGKNGYLDGNDIADYHYKIYEKASLSRSAWIGSLFHEFGGSGSWEFIYKDNIDILEADIINAVLNDEVKNGVNARLASKYLILAIPVEVNIALGLSVSAISVGQRIRDALSSSANNQASGGPSPKPSGGSRGGSSQNSGSKPPVNMPSQGSPGRSSAPSNANNARGASGGSSQTPGSNSGARSSTNSPVKAPTSSPTAPSSNRNTPTRTPIKAPTSSNPTPIKAPTSSNTPTPIKAPTSSNTPTQAPIKAPTSSNTPTQAPIKAPTSSNTPTQAPIKAPTSSNTPTQAPIKAPTSSNTPTQAPIKAPTSSNTPTQAPIKAPTSSNTPTQAPIKAPTSSNTPTQAPIKAPTSSNTPTPIKSEYPTPINFPWNSPTSFPSNQPIFNFPSQPKGSWQPIFTPTFKPVGSAPSSAPTFRPAGSAPSFAPSFGPTGYTPSSAPTFRPAGSAPSFAPSFGPTGYTPSSAPSIPNFNYGSYYNSWSSNFRMNDPTWLYSRGSATNGFESFRSYANARASFANLFGSYSGSSQDQFRNAYSKSSSGGNFYGSQYSNYGPNMAYAQGRARAGGWTGSMGGSIRYAASHVSPLVFDLKCDGLDLVSYNDGVYFDIDNDGFAEKIGWMKPEDGHLARDLNQNGKIDDITELFGDDITSAFNKLAMLDSNKDSFINAKDNKFHELLLWRDLNGNGYSESDELQSLTLAGIKSISLKTREHKQEIEGNLIYEVSSFKYVNGDVCTIADVHYHNNDMNSWYRGKGKLAGDTSYKKIRSDLEKFTKFIFAQLLIKLKEVENNHTENDWVKETIELATKQYIEEVVIGEILKFKSEAINKEYQESQATLENLFTISDEKFRKMMANIPLDLANDFNKKNSKAKEAAIAELKLKFQQQKDNIHSYYIQKLNQKIEELMSSNLKEKEIAHQRQSIEKSFFKEEKEEKIKAQREFDKEYKKIDETLYYENESKSEKLKFLNEEFEKQKQDMHNTYQEEKEVKINNSIKRIKDKSEKYKKELKTQYDAYKLTLLKYKDQLKKLEEQNEQEIKSSIKKIEKECKIAEEKEITNIRTNFRKKYIQEQQILQDKVVKDLKLQIEEESHLQQALYLESLKALVKFYHKDKQEKDKNLNEFISYLTSAIKNEADAIYTYVVKEAEFMEENNDSSAFENQEEFKTNESTNFNDQNSASITWFDSIYNYFFSKEQSLIEKIESWLQFDTYNNNTGHNKDYTDEEAIAIDPETLFMPMMRGYGQIASLHIAMSMDPILKLEVMNLMFIKAIDLKEIQQAITNILYLWAGVKNIDDNERSKLGSANIEARKVNFIEKITGQPFKQLGAANFVGQHASTSMQKAWDISLIRATKNLLIQGPLMSIFPKALYSFTDDEINLNSSIDEILMNAKKFASDNKLGYDFWVQIGYILTASIKELNVPMTSLKERLFELAGEPILVGLDPFSLIGNNQNNDIKGTSGSDYIKGLNGNDKLAGKDGSDFIEGGEGDDEIYGDGGIDRLHGGNGNDRIYGGDDRDFIYGDAGPDSIYGEKGDDYIEGGADGDYMDGGSGKNTLSYGMSPGGVKVNLKTGQASGFDAEGDQFKNFINLGGSEYNDVFIGDDQNNEINGEGGDDHIYGGKGDDQLFGAKGNDYLFGEDGDDILTGFEGADHMEGGSGNDTVDYSHPYAIVGVKVDLSKGTGTCGYAHGDTYISIENVKGSKFDDEITGDHNNNTLEGIEGNDTIHGGDGNDIIIDLHGNNSLYGDDGDDYIISVVGNFCFGGEGQDTISYERLVNAVKIDMPNGSTTFIDESSNKDTFTEFENAAGTNADDIIIGDDKDNKIFGLKGDDTIHGGGGRDEIYPGDGDDKIYGDKGNDYIMGSLGKDFYDGGEGIDTVDYSQETDKALYLNLKLKKMTGASFALGDTLQNIERIIGTKFNDMIIGDDENNHLYGHNGDDKIYGGDGHDILSGGKGKNELYGEDGGDIFDLAQGENLVYGGPGINRVTYENAEARVEIDLSNMKAKKSTGELDIFEDIHDCFGSKYNDAIIGNSEMNKLYGLDGDDYIDAGGGADTIEGGEGNNILLGGSGNDKFLITEGSNQVDGGSDIDTAIYAEYKKEVYEEAENIEREIKIYNFFLPFYSGEQFTKPIFPQGKGVTVNLITGIAEKPNSLNDKLTNVENLEGTHYDDVITGDDKDNVLQGNNGNDIIDGGKGDDLIISGRGHSKLYGGEGNDRFKVMKGTADIYGGEGNDSVNFEYLSLSIKVNLEEGSISYGNIADADSKADCKLEGVEAIRTTAFIDIVYDSKLDNHIETGEGNDIIYISDGNDIVDSGDSDDIIYLNGSGVKRLMSGSGSDKFVIMPGFISNNKIDVMIGDFKLTSDRIDLSNQLNIKDFSELKFEQIELEGSIFTIINIQEHKEIALMGIEIDKINSDHFIFSM